MKLRPVTKLDKINKATSKKFDAFPIYRLSGAIRKPDSGRMVSKTYTFIYGNLLSYKN